MTRHALIACPVRTPIGKFGGALRSLGADQLAVHVIQAVLARSGVPAESIDDVIASQSYASSEAPCIGRYAALDAGMPVSVAGYSLDRRCGSGVQAIANAAMAVQSGNAEAVLVVGVESMSNVEYYSTDMRWGRRAGSTVFHDRLERGRERSQPERRFGRISGMPETAENLARDYGVTRKDADSFAVRSHRLAAAAWEAGRFSDELVPIEAKTMRGASTVFERDEGVRPDASEDALAALRPLLPGGVTTAGNASQQNDAAAACLVVSEAYANRYALSPLARFAGWAAAGCEPGRMGIGPVPAVSKLLGKVGMTLSDIDLIELNEAFAAQAIAVLREWRIDGDERVNVNGSGISLGHPVGATGLRIMATLVYEMQRRNARFGLETMCVGGGQGMAALFERV
ncbi:acetyl-CoA C-acetyltransferase [Pandoraea terrigena]|uniref:Acetyl-CoA acetyltransferase n=1 Tax=Pandoraea terrigena TaxID=2508292 RepID=A0A5E4WPV5_9BURK|nr:acetyl-CoA C-acetyltransferase [Pandoraea terrigena]VVE25690.1 acetyl-CoA acetyltransferase [Pandoraea terrigena]